MAVPTAADWIYSIRTACSDHLIYAVKAPRCFCLMRICEGNFRTEGQKNGSAESFLDAPFRRGGQAITECIQEGILKNFLVKNRTEAKNVSIYEYDQEKHLRQEREDAWEDGRKDGLAEGERIGRDENRKELIQKKLQKGKTISEIADALEESEAEIQRLIEEMNK